MAKKEQKKAAMTPTQKVSVGVGLTAAAAAAVGAYFLYGSKHAAKNRKAVKSWALKAKAEVLEKLEEAKEMTQEEYQELVSNIAATYSTVKNASKAEVKAFKDEMIDNWKAIEKTAKPKKKAPAKKAAAKKAPAKKAVQK
jgi:gas vesicle protein